MAARFDARGGTLGRSDSNTLVLPDPRRHISRLQAEVVLQGTQYLLRNAGNANPIIVNQRSLPPGASAPLTHGDEVQIGGYVLRVTLEDGRGRRRTEAADAAGPVAAPTAHAVIVASATEPKTRPRQAPNQDGPSTVAVDGGPQATAGWRDLYLPPERALWRAFEQGIGIDALPAEARTPGLMAIVGRMLRTSIDGTLRLMAARAATAHELRAQTAAFGPGAANPLKLALDGRAAVRQLLSPTARGFMPPAEAMQDAMDDLLGHAVGTEAGMRAALQGVLVSNEAANRFDSLFGAAFAKAYAEQLDALARERRRGDDDGAPSPNVTLPLA